MAKFTYKRSTASVSGAPENTLWKGNLRRYPSLKKSSYELNLMLNQCQRIIGKDEAELNALLEAIKTQNAEYMGFVSKYVLTASNYQLLDTITQAPQKEKGLTTYLRSLDRQGIFEETFDQMDTMRKKALNFGTLTNKYSPDRKTITSFEYMSAYGPLSVAMDDLRDYFAPTDEDIDERLL